MGTTHKFKALVQPKLFFQSILILALGFVYCGTGILGENVLGSALYSRNTYLGVIAIDDKLSKPHRIFSGLTCRAYSDVDLVTKPSKGGSNQKVAKSGGKRGVPKTAVQSKTGASAASAKTPKRVSTPVVNRQSDLVGTQPHYDSDEEDAKGMNPAQDMPPLMPITAADRVMCYNCREYGHLSYDCTKPKKIKATLAKDKPVNIKVKGNAQGILEELDEDNGANDNGDHPLHGGTGLKAPAKNEDTEEAKAEKAAAAIEKKRIAIRAAIRTQLQCLLIRKDLKCPTDRKIVLSSCASIAKRAGAEEVPGFNVTDEVLEAFEETFAHSFEARLGFGTRLAQSLHAAIDVSYNAFWSTEDDFTSSQIYERDAMYFRGSTPLRRLENLEKVEPYSIPSIDRRVQWEWFLGKVGSHVMVPVFEELCKRIVSAFAVYMRWFTFVTLHHHCLIPLQDTLRGFLRYTGYDNPLTMFLVSLITLPDAVLAIRPGSYCLAAIEMRSWWRRQELDDENPLWVFFMTVFQFCLRMYMHGLLETLYLPYAIMFHLLWNCLAHYFWADISLKVTHWNEDLYKKFATEHASVCLATHNLKEHPVCDDFKVKEGEATCDNKFGTRCEWGIDGVTATVYRPCYHNEKISMNGRVGKKIPAHVCQNKLANITKHWKSVTAEMHGYFEKHIRRVLKPVPLKDWVNGFPPAKREMFQGLIDDCAVVPKVLKASSFIKKEIVVKAVDDLAFKDPRFVQGCPPELSLATGPSLRRLAKHVRSGLAPRKEKGHEPVQNRYSGADVMAGKHIVYTCGMSNQEIGDAYHRALNTLQELCPVGDKVVVLEDDQSRFDLHMGTGAFHLLNDVYSMKLSKTAARHLRRRPVIAGKTNLFTKYSIHAMMQSGWPDTSVGDTVVNATMKLKIHGIGRRWISIICGDDSVTVTLQSEIERLGGEKGLIELYEGFGMEIEAKVSDDPLVVEFCSSRFFWHGAGYYLVPKTGKMLAKLCWDSVERGPVQRKAWMRGIVATMDMFGQTDPLMCALGNNFRQQLGEGLVVKESFNEFKHVFRGEVDAPSEECVAMYYSVHYNMSWNDVCDCVAHLSTVKLGTISTHPLLRMLALVDC